mmetsp:Transcript_84977/g.160137  ORF Transcript_84977/g.160137 Transcript_84977/m.160137 type:complete len:188 (-) Transcript_84977:1561-2124(-)
MHKIFLALACLAYLGRGWQVQSSTEQLQSSPVAETHEPLKALDAAPLKRFATLLLALNSAAAFNGVGPGAHFPLGKAITGISRPVVLDRRSQPVFQQVAEDTSGYNPPTEFPMINLDAEFEEDVMKQVVGRKGFYFSQITEETGVKYIWWKKDQKIVEIWGPEDRLPLAASAIQQRIHLILRKKAQI